VSVQSAGDIALAGAVVFSILLMLLHFLKLENDPSWRTISEYEIGRHGWLMRLAFFCWSIGFVGLAVALWQQASTLGEGLLAIVAIGLGGAGIFAAEPITRHRDSQTRAGKLHSFFGVPAVLGIPITATVVDWSLSGNPVAAAIQSYLPWMSLMVWLGLLAMMSAFDFFGAKKSLSVRRPTSDGPIDSWYLPTSPGWYWSRMPYDEAIPDLHTSPILSQFRFGS
jgi:hypothetical protein